MFVLVIHPFTHLARICLARCTEVEDWAGGFTFKTLADARAYATNNGITLAA